MTPDFKYIGIIFALVVLLSSCTAPHAVISIEVLEPATITYPDDVHIVGYLNRSPRSFDSFSQVKVDSLTDRELTIIDTLICNAIKRGFKEGKSNSTLSYLDDMLFLEARRADTLFRDSIVSNGKVTEICKSFRLDALITQDYYAFKFDERLAFTGTWERVRILIQEARWTLSIPGRSKPLDTYTIYDTLYFINQSKTIIPKFATPLQMLAEGSLILGYNYGKRNVPAWNQHSRTVFVGGHKELREASKFTDKGDWEKAHHLWSQNLGSEDTTLSAKSAHNIAVYYELEDEVEQAVAFSRKANELCSDPFIEGYKQELELRLMNKKDVYKQLRMDSQ